MDSYWDDIEDSAQTKAKNTAGWDDIDDGLPSFSQGSGKRTTELKSGKVEDVPMGVDFKAAFSDDPMARFKVLSEKKGIPLGYFGRVHGEDGYRDPYTNEWVKLNDSVMSGAKQFVSDIAADIPTVEAGATAGTMIGSRFGPWGAGVGGLIGGGLGSYGKQKIGEEWTGDPVNLSSIALDASLGGIGGGVSRLGRRSLAPDIADVDPLITDRLKKNSRKYDIFLTEAEQSGLPSLVGEQNYLMGDPRTKDYMMKKNAERNAKSHEVVDDFMDSFTLLDIAHSGQEGVDAANKYLSKIKGLRAKQTKPLYDRARQEGVEFDASPIIANIDDLLVDAGEGTRDGLNRLKRNLYTEVKGEDGVKTRVLRTSYDGLNEALKDFKGMIQSPTTDSNAKRNLLPLKDQFQDMIETQSGDLAIANKAYAELSDVIGETEKGLIGKISKLHHEKAHEASNLIFSPNTSSPETVLRARIAISDANPEAWNGLIKSSIKRKMNKLTGPRQTTDSSAYGAGQANAFWKNEAEKSLYKAAMTPSQFENADNLQEILRKTSTSTGGGSPTQPKQMFQKGLLGKAQNAFSSVARGAVNPFGIPARADEAMQERLMDKYAMKLAEAIWDPSKQKQLSQLRQLSDREEIFQPAWQAFLTNLGGSAAGTGLTMSTDAPLKEDGAFLQYTDQLQEQNTNQAQR